MLLPNKRLHRESGSERSSICAGLDSRNQITRRYPACDIYPLIKFISFAPRFRITRQSIQGRANFLPRAVEVSSQTPTIALRSDNPLLCPRKAELVAAELPKLRGYTCRLWA